MNKILLVEDEAIELKILEYVLSTEYVVFTSTNGKEALNILKEDYDFELIISDINMETMDGIELKTLLNKDQKLKTIPFMFLTHNEHPFIKEKCLNLGADLYMHKPYEKIDILKEVSKIIKSKAHNLTESAQLF